MHTLVSRTGSLSLRPAAGAEITPTWGLSLEAAFARGPGHGLLALGADHPGVALPPDLAYWRDFAGRYVAALCALPGITEISEKPPVPPPLADDLERLAAVVPPMPGAEYISADVLAGQWRGLDLAFDAELAASKNSVQAFLKSRNPAWNLVGRVHFNLAENRKDDAAPFAFLATYTTRLSATAKAQHVPLGQALKEYAKDRDRLLSLLLPVQRAGETCAWLKAMVEAGEIYHPLRWTPADALRFLKDLSLLEAAGVIVRMPAAWRMNRPAHPVVKATIGGAAPSQLGLKAMLDFSIEVTLDGERLTKAEIADMLKQSEGLAFIRGQWVEIDHERLTRTLAEFEAVERRAAGEGLSFAEAMRLTAGANSAATDDLQTADWGKAVAGLWLSGTLAGLRNPAGLAIVNPGKALNAQLRPYQQAGVQWLYLLNKLQLGACLADDMGLGKTIQVLSLLLVLKAEDSTPANPSLLVAPASLLSNWASEIERFATGFVAVIAHPSAMPPEQLKKTAPAAATAADLVITSYGTLSRVPWLSSQAWRLAVIDEAQAIKNPGAKQTRAVKALKAEARIALTGTPIENRLGDLWSIFDFINPGLLGSAKDFTQFTKRLADRPQASYAPLRDLVRPYILRRMKTDRSIIADLPDKTEVKTFCGLTRKQAALYAKAVDELKDQLEKADGMKRRGLVLAFLMRFKQICNHPSQWLGDGTWAEDDSGKFARLRELAEVIAAKQEKALIFTQFKETTAPLSAFLASIFGRQGLVLHGETVVKTRKDLVNEFQNNEAVPYFVLSVKAGGAGLNLTAASHVIHFDRWWNPAVENQATDRAFRIGQKRNVLVHKFICQGTIEERIDHMIEAKKVLAGDFLAGGAEVRLTEMSDAELMQLVALDLGAAMREA